MKRFVKFIVLISSVIGFTNAFSSNEKFVLQLNDWTGKAQKTLVDTFYYEDFESGAPGWVSVDLTDIPRMWHPDTFQAYGGSGSSWWMGDPTIKGYLNCWYQVLDSPEIILPAGACSLKFMMNRAIEGLDGASSPYNGWDGFNVRISTDEGITWTVLANPTPAYNSTSMYSFGCEHEEGPNVPGWGGLSGGWVEVAFDISTYAEDTVKIRWAFASDPGLCTTTEPELFGVQIDDIDVAGVFSNAGEDTVGFTRTSESVVGGDLWHITGDAGCPSPINAVWCGDSATGTYKSHMKNEYISPLITLPVADTIMVQFWLRGGFHDQQISIDSCDYFAAQLSPDTGKTWYSFSNPTGDTLDTNYVYPIRPYTPWQVFSPTNISMYSGKSLLFKIYVRSDKDAPGDSSEGLFIDDFLLYTQESGVEEDDNKFTKFDLYQITPNPIVNNDALIRFSLPKAKDVSLAIYNASGQLVKTFLDNPMEAGMNSITWDTKDSDGKLVPGGIYFYKLKVGKEEKTNKVILIQ